MRGPQAITNGGVAVPSTRPERSTSSPVATTAAASRDAPSSSRRSVTRATLWHPAPVRRATPSAAALAAAVALAGCGSATIHELPPAAEPAHAPALRIPPAGTVTPVGAGAEGLAVDPRTHAVAVGVRAGLRLVGPGPVPLALPPAPRHLAFSPDAARFLVPTEGDDRLVQVDVRGAVVARTPIGARPHDAAVVAGRVFVGDERGNAVTVLRGTRRIASFAVATQPGGLSAADRGTAAPVRRGPRRTASSAAAPQPGGPSAAARGGLRAVVWVRGRRLELSAPRTLRRAAAADAGVGPTHVLAEAGRLYVADTQ